MTEREFYISIVPDVAEIVLYLKRLPKEDQEQIKEEMMNACAGRPAAQKFMEKLWITIGLCLKEGAV